MGQMDQMHYSKNQALILLCHAIEDIHAIVKGLHEASQVSRMVVHRHCLRFLSFIWRNYFKHISKDVRVSCLISNELELSLQQS